MKKFCGACVALLLCVLFAFAGCKADGLKAMKYVKGKRFVGNSSSYGGYRVELIVNDDYSYSLKVATQRSSLLNDYSVTGTTMEYLGYTEKTSDSSWLGVSLSGTNYFHVISLPEATIEDTAFFLVAEASSKHEDTFYMKLVTSDASYGKNDLPRIIDGGEYIIREA